MNIFFWQSNISPHQIPYISELSKIGNNVTLVVPKIDQLKIRKDSGWNTPDTKNVRIIVRPDEKIIADIFKPEKLVDCVHCFSGIDFNETVFNGFKSSLTKSVPRVLIVEGPDLRNIRIFIRYFYAKIKYWKYKNKIDMVMAIGKNARIYCEFIGVKKERITPFFYCVEDTRGHNEFTINDEFKAVYLGSLSKIKGVDILLKAYNRLGSNEKFHLDIYGSGPLEDKLKKYVQKYCLNNVQFKGVINNNHLTGFLNTYDLLILPSRKDGWGAVINEALMAGTPVLCSNNCGAMQLIETDLQGAVFKAGNVSDLLEKLVERYQRGVINPHERQKIVERARKIHKEQVAKYFLQNIEGIIIK